MPTPYEVTCECGEVLEIINRKIDVQGDVFVTVKPCGDCMNEAINDHLEANDQDN